jgi:riboflavin kinase/FMN adenylyltransferase
MQARKVTSKQMATSLESRGNAAALERAGSTVVTVGTYDGVHLGHRRLIEVACDEATRRGLRVVVVTFDRLPTSVLRPKDPPRLLTGLDHKLELLGSTGVDDIVVLRFDLERAAESAEDFVSSVLVGELKAQVVVIGENFRFGHKHRGDVAFLERAGKRLGFATIGVGLVTDEETHEVISATRIRSLVEAASLEQAAQLLGRPHELRGSIEESADDVTGEVGVLLDADLCLPPAGTYDATVVLAKQCVIETTVRVPVGAKADRSREETFVAVDLADPKIFLSKEHTSGARIALQLHSVARGHAPHLATTPCDDAR